MCRDKIKNFSVNKLCRVYIAHTKKFGHNSDMFSFPPLQPLQGSCHKKKNNHLSYVISFLVEVEAEYFVCGFVQNKNLLFLGFVDHIHTAVHNSHVYDGTRLSRSW